MRAYAAMVAFSCCVALSCSAEEQEDVTIELELVPDTRINRPEDIVREVRSVVVVIDSPEGLYPPGAESIEGNLEIKDADDDPSDLELVAVAPISNGRIPSIQLQRGGLPDVPLSVRVLGLLSPNGEGPPVAVGGMEGLRFTREAFTQVSVPFNLLPRMLPPRVMDVSVAEGGVAPGCDLTRILLTFSKEINPETVNQSIWFEAANREVTSFVTPFGNTVEIALASDLDDKSADRLHSLEVTSRITDLDGFHLDQDAAVRGDQSFRRSFHVRCDGSSDPVFCGTADDVGAPGSWCAGQEGRFECVAYPDQCEFCGRCEPASCSSVVCPPGYACDPSTAICDVDCRVYGTSISCPADRPTCDSATGACITESR